MRIEDTAIIIPTYNKGSITRDVIEEAYGFFKYVICVNDGSTDQTKENIEKTDAIVITHIMNIGQGGAIQTGINYAKTIEEIKYFVTFDSDGQHRVRDVVKMLETIRNEPLDIIIGSRFLDKKNTVPFLKLLLLKTAVIFTKLTVNLEVTDTHNGLRVFTRNFANKVDLKNYDFTHATEFLEIIKKNNFRYKEVAISIDYTQHSKDNGQPIINAVNILFDLIFRGKK